jgi:hypothetical protein
VQPEAELNFYSKDDPSRQIGSGYSDLDAGVCVRYEISRKFAPYMGFAYSGKYGNTAAIRVSWEKQHATTVSYLGFDSGSETLAPCYRVKVRDGSILKMGDEKNNFTPLIGRPLAVDHTSLSASQTEPEFIARPSWAPV